MKELKLIIDNPKLERELDKFEAVAYFRDPKPGESTLGGILGLSVIEGKTPYPYVVLTPKPEPLSEPDWSKLGFLQPGWWVEMDRNGEFFTYEGEPKLRHSSFEWLTSCNHALRKELFGAALPTIPLERWREAKWQVPERK